MCTSAQCILCGEKHSTSFCPSAMSNGQCLVKVEFDETVTDACDDCYERVVQWLLSCEHNDLYTYGPWTLREPVPYNISREAACRLMKAEPGQRQQLYNNIQYAEKVLAYYRANPIPPPSHVLYYYQQAFRSPESANERQMSWKAEKADMNRGLYYNIHAGWYGKHK